MKTIKVTMTLLAGLAAGATVGLLFAPQTGTATRDELNESLANLGDYIKKVAAGHIDKLVGAIPVVVIDAIKLNWDCKPANLPMTWSSLDHH